MARRRREEDKRAIVDEFAGGSEQAKYFCLRHQISPETLKTWIWLYRPDAVAEMKANKQIAQRAEQRARRDNAVQKAEREGRLCCVCWPPPGAQDLLGRVCPVVVDRWLPC